MVRLIHVTTYNHTFSVLFSILLYKYNYPFHTDKLYMISLCFAITQITTVDIYESIDAHHLLCMCVYVCICVCIYVLCVYVCMSLGACMYTHLLGLCLGMELLDHRARRYSALQLRKSTEKWICKYPFDSTSLSTASIIVLLHFNPSSGYAVFIYISLISKVYWPFVYHLEVPV